jgi:hypothetical protein
MMIATLGLSHFSGKTSFAAGPTTGPTSRPMLRGEAGSDPMTMDEDGDPRRRIVLTGFWPPTDTGSMLANWATMQEYEGSGYDVIATTFAVDYEATAWDVWGFNGEEGWEPIAIMSFGADYNPGNENIWVFEPGGRNLAHSAWANPKYDIVGNVLTVVGEIPYPYIGGSANDPSPYNGTGTQTGDPPDPTQSAGDPRSGDLDTGAMADLINDDITYQMITTIGTAEDGPDHDLGSYLCEFMAYHIAWYKEEACAPGFECDHVGFVHVGCGVSSEDGARAVAHQLDVLIGDLP